MLEQLKDYSFFDKKCKSKYNRICIDGKMTGCGKCVGYCTFDGHPGFLTEKNRQSHQCIEKECLYYLEKPTREKKKVVESSLKNIIFNSASEYLSENEGVKLMRSKTQKDKCIIEYIAITNLCDLESCAKSLSQEFGIAVVFERLMYSFDNCVKIIMAS